jgi:basic amino acid/polyamine antiporter, APA family
LPPRIAGDSIAHFRGVESPIRHHATVSARFLPRFAMPASPSEPPLVRAVSRWQLVGLSINDVIGSGIYLLPAAAAALLGPASAVAVIAAGLAVTLLVLCFAEASSYFDAPGGAYVYTREAFGDFIGFEVGWMTWLARIASLASLANGFALATAFLWPAAATGGPRAALIVGALGLLTWINVLGVKKGAGAAVAFTILKLIPIVFFVLVGIFFVDWTHVSNLSIPPSSAFGQAALLLLFAYAGFENLPAAAGEYKNPRRDVPFALITMIITVTLLYTLVQFVALGTHPELAKSTSPLAESAARFAGGGAAFLLTLGAMVSIIGNLSNTTLMGPRYLFALAQDGYGPKQLARVHPRYRTPAVAIVTLMTIALILALSGSFVQLALLSIVARLTTYIGTAAAVPILRRRLGHRPDAFRLPGGPTIPIAALLVCLVFLASTQSRNLIAGAIALAVGAVTFKLRRRGRSPSAR